MKKLNYWLFMSLTLVLFSCSDDKFEPVFNTSFENTKLSYLKEGGTQTFDLESNETWKVGDTPDWVSVKVEDNEPSTRSTTYVGGKKKVYITVTPNITHEVRKAEIMLTSNSNKTIQLTVEQAKTDKLVGYWILSEGYAGSNNSELAWYNVESGELLVKQFNALNGTKLGDTGNDLEIYGSKMYCVVSGPGMGNKNTPGTNYIEVINPANGKSIKRIPFTDAAGNPAKPRYIVFEGGKGYVSSYGNEVVRLDTASLALDAHAALSGTFAEELAVNGKNIYVCNSGHGEDNKISIVDINSMKETKVITTAKNPTGIVSAGENQLFFNTNFPEYAVYKLNTSDNSIEQIKGIKASTFTNISNTLIMPYFDWKSYEGTVYTYNIVGKKSGKLLLDYESVGIKMMMEYKLGRINGSTDIFLSGNGQDVLIIDPITKSIKYSFKTKVANGSGVVAYYK